MSNERKNQNANQGSQLCVSAGDVDDPTESTNFEDDSNSEDEYYSFVLELNKGMAPQSQYTDDCPEKESFLHGSLVFVPTGVPAIDIVSENNAASGAPLGSVETDWHNTPIASKADPKIRDVSYFLRRRRSVVRRRFLVFVLTTMLLAVGWILTKKFTDHQQRPLNTMSFLSPSDNDTGDSSEEKLTTPNPTRIQQRTPEATLFLGPSDNGTGDSSEEKLAQTDNDTGDVSSHRDHLKNSHLFYPYFAPVQPKSDERLGSTEAKVRKGKSSRKSNTFA
jgi:hypothetical protein